MDYLPGQSYTGLLDHRERPIAANFNGRDTQHFAASRTAREVREWDVPQGDANSDNNEELESLTSRSRDLDRNNGLAKNIRVVKGDNIIGTGLQISPMPNWRVLGMDPDWAAEWSKNVKAHWNDYARSRFVDADGEDNFHQLTRLVYNSEFLSGAGIAIPMWKKRAGSIYRTCFKIIEADRLCNENDVTDTARIAGGVERANDGEIIAYWIRNTHPGADDQSEATKWERIPAYWPSGRKRFIHVYEKTRPGQSRGVTAASNVLAAFGLLGKYTLTELQSQAINAKITQVLETPLSDEQAAELFGGKKEDFAQHRQNWSGRLDAGSILKLPVGTTLKSHDPKRPAPAFVAFIEHHLREIGAGFGLPFELAMRNFSKTNYSSARAALLEAWRHFYVERQRLIYQLCNPMFDCWLEEAVDNGTIIAPDFQRFRTAYGYAEWYAPSHLPIDQLKTANANKIRLETGTITKQRIAIEEGEDWEDLAEQRLKERVKDMETELRFKKAKAELEAEHGITADEPPPSNTEPDPSVPESDEEMDEQEQDQEEQEAIPDDEQQAA